MDINTTTVVNGADGTSFDMPGAWEATQVQSNYSQFSGMRASVEDRDGARTITFSPITGAKG
jgi:hypothetical protein